MVVIDSARDIVDFKKIVNNEFKFFDENQYKKDKEFHDSQNDSGFEYKDEWIRNNNTRKVNRLNFNIINWLNKNIKDFKNEKGFCFGNDLYNSYTSIHFNIWFKRKKDALKFIETWSVHKKPTTYFDYFREVRKELNLETNILQKVDQFRNY